jgi:hypothetical protein
MNMCEGCKKIDILIKKHEQMVDKGCEADDVLNEMLKILNVNYTWRR